MAARCDSKSSEKKVTISQKSLSWKDNQSERAGELVETLIAERVASVVTSQLLDALQGTLRDATASALQQLSTATSRVSRLLDRLEDKLPSQDAQINPADATLSGASSSTKRVKPKKSSATFHAILSGDGTFASHAHSGISVPVPMLPLMPAGKKRVAHHNTLDSDLSWESVARDVRGDEPQGQRVVSPSRRAKSLQGYAVDEGSDQSGKVSKVNSSRKVPGIPSLLHSQKSSLEDITMSGDLPRSKGKLEKMGMKDLESKLTKELFLQRGPGSNGLQRQISPGKEAGSSSENLGPVLRRQGSKKVDHQQHVLSPAFPVMPVAHDSPAIQEPTSSAPILEDISEPPGTVPQRPGKMPDLSAQEQTTSRSRSGHSDQAAGGRGSLGPAFDEEAGGSSSSASEDVAALPQRVDSSALNRPETDTFKRNITGTCRSKRDTAQLRDEKNEELIRATIKSVPGFTSTDPPIAPVMDEDEEEPSTCVCLDKVGNAFIKLLSWINCSESPCQTRIGTALFHMVLVLAATLAISWDVGSVIIYNVHGIDLDLRPYPFYDSGLAFGAFLCLMCCMRTSVAECETMLDAFALAKEITADWQAASRRDAFQVISFWLVATGERARELAMDFPAVEEGAPAPSLAQCLTSAGCFSISIGILLACLFRILRLCRGFYIMLDDFSFQLVSSSDLRVAEQEWNLLQALLRRSCSSLQYLFIVLQSTIAVALILGLDDFYRAGWNMVVSGAIVLMGIAQMFLHAASVTDHCERLPSFVNSLGFGRELDADRLYLVEYMFYSQAGFYVFEVRLTRDMVLKAFYICGVGVFYFVTKVMSGSSLGI